MIKFNVKYVGYDKYIENMLKSSTSIRELNKDEKSVIDKMISEHPIQSIINDFVDSIVLNKISMNTNMHNGRSKHMTPKKLTRLNEEWATLIGMESLLFSGLKYISNIYDITYEISFNY